MNLRQKRYAEFFLLLILIWFLQGIEISLLNSLPLGFSPISLTPILLAYISITRSFTRTVFLALVFSFLVSPAWYVDWTLNLSVLMTCTIICKSFVSAFALEGRKSLVLLSAAFHFAFKVLSWALLSIFDRFNPLYFSDILHYFSSTALLALFAWTIYPLLIVWDRFFEHEHYDSSLVGEGL